MFNVPDKNDFHPFCMYPVGTALPLRHHINIVHRLSFIHVAHSLCCFHKVLQRRASSRIDNHQHAMRLGQLAADRARRPTHATTIWTIDGKIKYIQLIRVLF